MYDLSLALLENRVSRIFPETAWWVMNFRQATHTISTAFLGCEGKPPSGTNETARIQPNSWFFL